MLRGEVQFYNTGRASMALQFLMDIKLGGGIVVEERRCGRAAFLYWYFFSG